MKKGIKAGERFATSFQWMNEAKIFKKLVQAFWPELSTEFHQN